jgi:competence protein ComEC
VRHGLALLALAVALGLALGDAWPGLGPIARWVALATCAADAFVRRAPRLRAVLALLAAAAAASAVFGARVEGALAALRAPASDAIVEGDVAAIDVRGAIARIELARVAWVRRAAPAPSRCLVRFADASRAPTLGARVRIALRTQPLREGVANPGGADAARALARRGIGCSARAVDPLLVHELEAAGPDPRTRLEDRRQLALGRLNVGGRGGALLAALGLGDASAIPERDRRAWAALGIAHILSVSGLHLALAAVAAYAFAARALRCSAALCARLDTRRLALGVAVAAAAVYAALAGAAPPAQRSLLMLAAVAAAAVARRAVAPASGLALAALGVLALEPSALFAPGAQLSFAATAGLVLGRATDAERRRPGLARTLCGLLASGARASAATAGLAALHFGASPPLAGVANVVAVPVTGFVAIPLAFVTSALALMTSPEPLAALLPVASRAVERGLDALLALAALTPRTPPQPPAELALALWLGFTVCTLATRRLALALASAAFAQGVLTWLPPPAIAPPAPRLVVLDVGHGDAVLVQGEGAAGLVDAGTATPYGFDAGARIVVPALAALGVRRLDFLAITHADLDHRGGALAVLEAFPVAELWLPRGARSDPAFAELLGAARARGLRVRERGAGDVPFAGGGLRVTPLWPPAEPGTPGDNDRSLVLRVEAAGVRALLLGDLEAAGEAALLASGADLRADFVKLGHHGSKTSSSTALLDAARPRLALVSAPREGRFRWPHREVRERLGARRTEFGLTARDGALLVPFARGGCVRRWRAPESCRVPPAE